MKKAVGRVASVGQTLKGDCNGSTAPLHKDAFTVNTQSMRLQKSTVIPIAEAGLLRLRLPTEREAAGRTRFGGTRVVVSGVQHSLTFVILGSKSVLESRGGAATLAAVKTAENRKLHDLAPWPGVSPEPTRKKKCAQAARFNGRLLS